jgi:nicotinate phosphoribosyltransferase
MLQAYLDWDMQEHACFELSIRELPSCRSYLVLAGLSEMLRDLTEWQVTPEEMAYLTRSGRFRGNLLGYLRNLRFTGDIYAMPEGSLSFGNQPILRVEATLPQAQLLETRIMAALHHPTVVATKAARMRRVAPDKLMVDFGLRRSQGMDAGTRAAYASHLAGFQGSASVPAELRYGVPLYGTMAHSFVQAHAASLNEAGDPDGEKEAFRRFAQSRPDQTVYLVDTFDMPAALNKILELAAEGTPVKGIRLDSGDLLEQSRQARQMLDAAGLREAVIFVSGGLDEQEIAHLESSGAPIDGYGVGTKLHASPDAPHLDLAYKLTSYAGHPSRKLSPGKSSPTGRRQVYRDWEHHRDTVAEEATEGPAPTGEPMLRQFIANGKLTRELPSLAQSRDYVREQIARLPAELAFGQMGTPGHSIWKVESI